MMAPNSEMTIVATNNNINEKTLITNDSGESQQQQQQPFKEKFWTKTIVLSNAGNIDIDINCYFCHPETKKQTETLLLLNNNYKLVIYDSFLTLPAECKSKQHVRLCLTKINRTTDANLKQSDTTVKLTIQLTPNGLTYDIPIKCTFEQQQLKPFDCEQIPVQLNNSTRKQSSLSVKSKSQVTKLASSRSILFFGKDLSASTQLNGAASLINEFSLKNVNEKGSLQCQLTISLMNNSSKVSGFFYFLTNDNTETTTTTTLKIDAQKVELIKVAFSPPSFDRNQIETINGIITIKPNDNTQFRIKIRLVGFMNAHSIEIVQVDNILTKQLINSSIEKHLTDLKIPISSSLNCCLSTKTTLNQTNQRASAIIRIKNKENRCLVYPLVMSCFDSTNKWQLINPKGNNNQKIYQLNSKERLIISTDNNKQNDSQQFFIELSKENEFFDLNIEYQSSNDSTNKSYKLLLLSLEYSIYLYSTLGLQHLNKLTNQSTLNDSTVNSDNFIDSFVAKLLSGTTSTSLESTGGSLDTVNNFDYENHLDLTLMSTSMSTSMLSQAKRSSKSSISQKDFIRLVKESLKCSILNIEIVNNQNSLESLQIDNKLNSIQSKVNSSWSITPNIIEVDNFPSISSPISTNDHLARHFKRSFHIRNHYHLKTLKYEIKYRSAYVRVEPNYGFIESMGCVEVNIIPLTTVLCKLPWQSVINVFANNMQNDIRLSYSGVNKNGIKS
jgi:hypothetical protein